MAKKSKRNTQAMLDSSRCGAKTRNGTPCASPAVAGKKRCRMHGGAPGSGAPRGNQNALKDGFHTRAMKLFKFYSDVYLKSGTGGMEWFGYRQQAHFLEDWMRTALDSLFEEEKIPD